MSGSAICGGNGGCYFPQKCMATGYRLELTSTKGFYMLSIGSSGVKVIGEPVYADIDEVKLARTVSDGFYLNSGQYDVQSHCG